jgi:hypothetical protein
MVCATHAEEEEPFDSDSQVTQGNHQSMNSDMMNGGQENTRQNLMIERQQKIMTMSPEQQERREEMIENHQKKMGNRLAAENHEKMLSDPKETKRHDEMIEEHQNSLDDHAERMKNRPEDEESPNPGEPVIP